MIRRLRTLTGRCRTLVRGTDHQRGQSLIIVAFLIIALLAAVGLAVDLGLMYVERVRIGRAVDAAALAGAQELPDTTAAHDRMLDYLRLNGYEEGDEGFSFGFDFPREPECPPAPADCARYHLVVSATQEVSLTFMRVLGFQTVDVSASAVGENANRLDIAIVLDVSGSMDDDTCTTAGISNGCDYSWWTAYDEIIFEDFEDYEAGDGPDDEDRLCHSSSPWSCERPWQVGVRNDWANRYSGNYAQTEGDGTDGRFYMEFDASSYDQVEVVLRERTFSAGWGDYNSAWYSRAGGGWTLFMDEGQEEYWDWRSYLLQGQTSEFGLMFGSRSMELQDYGLWDEIRIRGMVNGPEPSGPLGTCPGYGDDDCAGGGYRKQPLWDTLNAADWFISECQIGSGPTANPCLDPDLDQVGLAYYSDDGTQTNFYPSSGDSTTAAELSFDYAAITNTLWTAFDASGWTNIGDGLYRGCEILSTNEADGHNGRTNAVHVMILLSDGIPNRPCPSGWSQLQCEQPGTWPRTHINNAVDWAVQNGIVIFTISLGERADPILMADIAEATGGTHSYAASTDDLIPVFQDIAEHIFLRLVR
jgi:hypothetical protein